MKKHFSIIVFITALAIVMTACDYKNPPGLDHVDNSEYYVMYTISSSFYNFGDISYADTHKTVKERTGNYSNTSNHWSVTIGPVKKGFKAFVKYESGFADIVKLEVSKNGSPFALKKASGDRSASFTINF